MSHKKARGSDDSFGVQISFQEPVIPNALEGSSDKPSKICLAVGSIDPKKDNVDSLVFQQLEVGHYVGSHITGMPEPHQGPCPVLRMYGVNMDGNSVLAHIHCFLPYLYVFAPAEDFSTEHCTD